MDEPNTGRSFAEIQANSHRISIQNVVAGDRVKIDLADSSPSMPENVKSRIFDRLFTTKAVGKGTGWGLEIASQIVVEKNQGAIEVNSPSGSGTEFALTLPHD